MKEVKLPPETDIWYDFFGFNAYRLHCVISKYKPKSRPSFLLHLQFPINLTLYLKYGNFC